MLDFEKLDGFVIDLTNRVDVEDRFCDVFDCDEPLCDIESMRYHLLNFYTDTYPYVFCKRPYVYQIVEDELQKENL